ncbi:MAG TPA: response regulator [Bryobacteraceae bacterium]|nr:response regulator [Bryobacteraceae bacterium]
MPKPRLLILDDDPHLTEALELWFNKRNYEIETASDGEEGLLILRSEKNIELVVADFMMPGLNGLELLQLMKSSNDLFHIKMLIMSHNENPEFRNRALQLGAIEYISKADGAKSIVERAIQTLDGTPAGPAAPAAGELRLMSESLLNLIQVTSMTDGLPPSARAALVSAQKLAQRIHAIAS